MELRRDVFSVNGQPLDVRRYPVPRWLRGREMTTPLGQGQYFVSCDYLVQTRGRALDNNLIRQVCVVDRGRVETRAFMLWWPLSRRGRIEVD